MKLTTKGKLVLAIDGQSPAADAVAADRILARFAVIDRVEVDDATVERVAAAHHAQTTSWPWGWEVMNEETRNAHRRIARAVLAALTEDQP